MKHAETRNAENCSCRNCAQLAARLAELEAYRAALKAELERARKRRRELELRLGQNPPQFR